MDKHDVNYWCELDCKFLQGYLKARINQLLKQTPVRNLRQNLKMSPSQSFHVFSNPLEKSSSKIFSENLLQCPHLNVSEPSLSLMYSRHDIQPLLLPLRRPSVRLSVRLDKKPGINLTWSINLTLYFMVFTFFCFFISTNKVNISQYFLQYIQISKPL